MQFGIGNTFTKYISISILSGISIAIAYMIITNKKMNNILKFGVGYMAIMLIVPQILWYVQFSRFFGFFEAYYKTPNIIYFYLAYTGIFILMYMINYRVGIKMTRELNQRFKKENK